MTSHFIGGSFEMNTALKWGLIFGIPQAAITLIVSLLLENPVSTQASIAGCIGLVLSLALSVACGFWVARKTKSFLYGLLACLVATLIDTLAGIVGMMIQPSFTEFIGLMGLGISFAVSFILGMLFGASGVVVGLLLSRSQATA